MLKKKTIILGVTGGIAAYKAAELTRQLVEAEAEVHVMMTRAAQQFITPLTLQTLSGHPVHTDLFNLVEERLSMGVVRGRAGSSPDFSEPSGLASGEQMKQEIGHISIADRADLIIIAPASADILAKIAHGICDDLITTVLCATQAPVLLAPAMNVHMWENKIVQENIQKLKKHGFHFLEPDSGYLACGYTGKGRLPDSEKILETVKKILSSKKK